MNGVSFSFPFAVDLMRQKNSLIRAIGAGFVKLMVGLWLDAAIILGVVIINALFGFIHATLKVSACDCE
jgi:hypothetical protein